MVSFNIRAFGVYKIQLAVFIFFLLYLMLLLFETSVFQKSTIPTGITNLVLLFQYNVTEPKLVYGYGNFEPRSYENPVGPGENGEPHFIPLERLEERFDSISEYRFNLVASDEISLDRTIKDTRLEECKHWWYPYDLPKTSVIITFYNEGFSTLLRTIHSVINRTPEQLLLEIILIDNFSDSEDLANNLEKYLQRFDGKVRLIRNSKRISLVDNRAKGVREASGEVVVFLEPHCEVNINWLPPLLAPIYMDNKTLSVPIIDDIDYRTFEYRSPYKYGEQTKGIFDWDLTFREIVLQEKDEIGREYNSEPYYSPVYGPGVFAINRKYFLELGSHDSNLKASGGENFELSFKIWQCGGNIKWIPCSRIGYIRKKTAHKLHLDRYLRDYVLKFNKNRVIEVWFDKKYKEYFYTKEPLFKDVYLGDISNQLALKKNLKCKSFQWFMDHVANDVFKYSPVPAPSLYFGILKLDVENICLQIYDNGDVPAEIYLDDCRSFDGNQLIRLNTDGQLVALNRCIEDRNYIIGLENCKFGAVDGFWKYEENTKHLRNTQSDTCLSLKDNETLKLRECHHRDKYQEWTFDEFEFSKKDILYRFEYDNF